jgi:hypothetical protein
MKEREERGHIEGYQLSELDFSEWEDAKEREGKLGSS